MTVKRTLLLVALCAAASTGMVRYAHAEFQARQPQPLEWVNAVPCCEQDLERIRTAASMPVEWKYVLHGFVDTSLTGASVQTAELYGCTERNDGTYYDCDIYVTQKFKRSASRDELLGVLAHEVGHVAYYGYYRPGSIESEYLADRFAVDTLRALGINPRTMLTTLLRLSREEVFSTPDAQVQIRQRIQRMRELLDAKK